MFGFVFTENEASHRRHVTDPLFINQNSTNHVVQQSTCKG